MNRLWIIAGLLLIATPVQADPITATHGGCIDTKTDVVATWTASTHMRHTALWSQAAGCHATGDDYMEMGYLIDYLINDDGTSSLTFHSDRIRVSCGRIQIDTQLGDFVSAIVVNLGTDCDRRGPIAVPTSFSVIPEVESYTPHYDPPYGDIVLDPRPMPTPEITPFNHPVPDGGSTLMLLLVGLAIIICVKGV